jgi:hypothetical protein
MFFFSFFSMSHLREVVAARATACATRTHFLVAPSPSGTAAARAMLDRQGAGVRHTASALLRRVSKSLARAALRAAYVGNPLTPTGYAILALTVAAVALVAMLSTSSVSNELDSALRVSWWFS